MGCGEDAFDLGDDEIESIKQACKHAGIQVSAIGSPIGKSPLDEPNAIEERRLTRAFEIADHLEVSMVRVFSFYPPGNGQHDDIDKYIEPASARLTKMASRAAEYGKLLVLEKQKGIVGDTVDRCRRLLDNVASDRFRICVGSR